MNRSGFMREHIAASAVVYRLVDVAVIAVTAYLAVYITAGTFGYAHAAMTMVVILSHLFMSDLFGLYRSWRGDRYNHLMWATFRVLAVSFIALGSISFIAFSESILSRELLLVWFIGSFVLFNAWRYVTFAFLLRIRRLGHNRKTYAIIGVTEAGIKLRNYIDTHPELGLDFKGFFDDRRSARLPCDRDGNFDAAIQLARTGEVDQIYIALTLRAEDRINEILLKCGDTTCDVYMVPDLLTFNLLNSRVQYMGDQVSLSVYESPYMGSFRVLKRMIDIVFSVGILAVIALPMLAIAVGIKLTTRGPILFKQRRYGLGGKHIEVWKFRTMTTADDGDNVKQVTKHDDRVTPLGRVLRKHSLDELPQFFNVLHGEMSIVGPRPHAVAHNEEYRHKVSYYMLRHKVKPGITGWAQVNGWRGETDTLDKMEQRVEHDLEYIRRWTPWFDIQIIFMTVFRGFNDDNVY